MALRGSISRDVEPRKFERPHFVMRGLIEDRIIERYFAIAEDMNVAKADVARIRNANCIGKWGITADDPIAEVVPDGNVVRLSDFKRQRRRAWFTLLLGRAPMVDFISKRVDGPCSTCAA